jgi:hypothetical protein
MKRLFFSLLLIVPVCTFAQKKKKEKLTPEQLADNYLHDQMLKHHFDTAYMQPYSLAGKEDGYPVLSKEMIVNVTRSAGDINNFLKYAATIRDTLIAINKQYIDILLNVEGDKFKEQLAKLKYTETKTVYDVEYRKGEKEQKGSSFSGDIYAPGRGY